MSYEYITSTGAVVPDTSVIKATVEAEYKSVYGENISLGSATEIGRMVEAETAARIAAARNTALLANQINPNYADGVWLDSILALSGSSRDGSVRSSVPLTLYGDSGTIVYVGAECKDDNGIIWKTIDDATITASGSVETQAECETDGAVSAAVGTITTIHSGSVLGWTSVNNLESATVGRLEQSDSSARAKRKSEIGLNSISNTHSIIGGLSAVDGVLAVAFRENRSSNAQVIDNISMTGNSIWVCVDGGSNADVSAAIMRKSAGVGFNGSVSVPFTDPISGQVINVLFDRPTEKPTKVRVTARLGTGSVESVKQSVINYAASDDIDNAFRVGNDSSPFEIGAAINDTLPGTFIARVEIAELSGVYSTDTMVNELYEKASITEANIEVVSI